MTNTSDKNSHDTSTAAAEAQSAGVQLSRRALFLERLEEIEADVKAGRCPPEEATERYVAAAMAANRHRYTECGNKEVEELLRQHCETDPALREFLGLP